jgi:hypothetical protein
LVAPCGGIGESLGGSQRRRSASAGPPWSSREIGSTAMYRAAAACVWLCACYFVGRWAAKRPEVMGRRGSTGEVTPSKSSGSVGSMTVWLGTPSIQTQWGTAGEEPPRGTRRGRGGSLSFHVPRFDWELSDWLCTLASRGYREAPGNSVDCLVGREAGSHIRQSGMPARPPEPCMSVIV